MSIGNLPPKSKFAGKKISRYILLEEIGRGKNGVVYKAMQEDLSDNIVAIKLIPKNNLKLGWEEELKKVVKLTGIKQVIQLKDAASEVELEEKVYICIFMEFFDGFTLKEYVNKNPDSISIPFVMLLIEELLTAFIAMKEMTVFHGDLHEANVLIGYDKRLPDPGQPSIKISDFGIGGSKNGISPKEDYAQFAKIISGVLFRNLDPSKLQGEDKFYYNMLIEDFISKKILEDNHSAGEFVRDPRKLLIEIRTYKYKYQESVKKENNLPLQSPFDYLSCEEMGDSFNLLQKLYSNDFPGYDALMLKNNTILTGPRGCGKTTIFKNLSLKTELIGRKVRLTDVKEYIGIYYHCRDIHFAFPYITDIKSIKMRQVIVGFFNLAIFYEILDTLKTCNDLSIKIDDYNFNVLQTYLSSKIKSYKVPPKDIVLIDYILSFVNLKKEEIKSLLEKGSGKIESIEMDLLPLDFIQTICAILKKEISWLDKKVFYFFIDDYSLPRISEGIQETLNDIFFQRYSDCFFKISTESIATFYSFDSTRKLIEQTREYDIVDFGEYFLHADEKDTNRYLTEIINNRFKNTAGIHENYHDINTVLGKFDLSYKELADQIKLASPGKKILYYGWDMVVNLCSGDIVNTLRLVRNVIVSIGGIEYLKVESGISLPIDKEVQDKAFKTIGNEFLNRIQSAPQYGEKIRKIAEGFGNLANWYLKNRTSLNVNVETVWQAYRIEIKDRPSIDLETLERTKIKYSLTKTYEIIEIQKTYESLLRYGIFLSEMGKSQRGAVVPRLYLRRLLLPTFLLTPNRRDNIGLEPEDFMLMLIEPELFSVKLKKEARKKEKAEIKDTKAIEDNGKQEKLF